MAVLWQQRKDGVLYEVRSAGRTRRLYSNGVFHSQYNPATVLTGSVWDLLMLPAFWPAPGALRRVLILGVGGGAVIRQLRHFFSDLSIVGVELSDVHIDVARKYFDIPCDSVELICADAAAWVKQYRGPHFDLIIDDVFGEEKGEPVRAIQADVPWFEALAALLSPRGMLVMNFISRPEFTNCAFFHNKRIRKQFKSAFQLTTEYYVNYVGAFLKQASSSQHLRRNLLAQPQLKRAYEQGKLRYRIKKV